jgi:orotate phosphoribosyltransferase
VEQGFADTIRSEFPDAELLMGTSTAGIAHAAIAAYLLDLPMGYVRSSAKDHGRTNRIEGRLDPGAKTVVVEDLISTAGSAVETADALKEAGANVLGIVSIFTYGMKKAEDRLETAGYRNVSLCSLDVLLEVAAERGYIRKEDIERIKRFRSNPDDPSWQH